MHEMNAFAAACSPSRLLLRTSVDHLPQESRPAPSLQAADSTL